MTDGGEWRPSSIEFLWGEDLKSQREQEAFVL